MPPQRARRSAPDINGLTQDDFIKHLVRVWNDPGQAPQQHARLKQHIADTWPGLYIAVSRICMEPITQVVNNLTILPDGNDPEEDDDLTRCYCRYGHDHSLMSHCNCGYAASRHLVDPKECSVRGACLQEREKQP